VWFSLRWFSAESSLRLFQLACEKRGFRCAGFLLKAACGSFSSLAKSVVFAALVFC